MSLRIAEEASLTDVGRQRAANEDDMLARPPVYAVADGMGGARAGEVASHIAIEAFDEADGNLQPEARLEKVFLQANEQIHKLSREEEELAGMGTTLTAMLAGDHEIHLGHVGDSRAYRLRDEELERLTDDHSLVEELVRQGRLEPEQAETHPQRSIITRALGPEPEVEVDTSTYPARAGDVYVLCSDGLTSMVPEPRIAEVLRGRSSLEQAARELVDMANEAGGRDNITVVAVRVEDEDTPDSARAKPADTGQLEAAAVRKAAKQSPQTSPAPDATAVISAEEAERARAGAPPARQPAAGPPLGRRVAGIAVSALVAGALLTGLYVGSRQFYFVGTSDQGLVTLFRGLPYDLPLGIELYTEEYVTTVPGRSLPARQRKAVLDHSLRGKGDAVDLVRQLERDRTGS